MGKHISEFEWKNEAFRLGLEITESEREIGSKRWRDVALIIGWDLSMIGPPGYYDFTPNEWLDFALTQWHSFRRKCLVLDEEAFNI